MAEITKPTPREIVVHFADEIRQKRQETVKPSKAVINFRTDMKDRIEREVYRVPIALLRYRKDNGRIASDVADYERNVEPLNERDARHQAVIEEFLAEKDPELTETLKHAIVHDGQIEPAIVTCDGFLVNGNRRKMVMAKLHHDFPNNPEFEFMKVVMLPGPGEPGGPPSLLEIEQIENRYQLQNDGKAEYYGFDRALSIRRKIKLGLGLREQLRDDPRFACATEAEMKRAEARLVADYLGPLDCVDRYLRQFGRDGQYRTVSTGASDKGGRWQAFLDYYGYAYHRCFENPKSRQEHGIAEEEIGAIEKAAFDIIRIRAIPHMPKVHMIMRELPKYCKTDEGKKELLRISQEVSPILPPSESVGRDNKPLTMPELDAKWAAKHKQTITRHIRKCALSHDLQKEKETPLDLLEAAYKKLTNTGIDFGALAVSDLGTARHLVAQIKDRCEELKALIYRYEKEYKHAIRGKQ